jgi:predicted nucleic acid-binding protein
MVGVDETMLSLMLHPAARPPKDPATGKLVERVPDRIEKLLEDLDADNERIIIPAPALCEFLVLAGKDGPAYLDKIHESKTLLVRPFDEMAAIELAAMEHDARSGGSKKGTSAAPWTKVKFDRQIVAICKVNGATRIYSDDEDIDKFGTKAGLDVVPIWKLPLPSAKQIKIDYEDAAATGNDE